MDRLDCVDDTFTPRQKQSNFETTARSEWSRTSRSRRHAATDRYPNLCNGLTKRMQATARRLSVVSATSPARRRLIRDVRPTNNANRDLSNSQMDD